MAWSEKARCVLVANGGDDGQGKVRMVKATLLKSQSAAIYIAILAKATVTPGPDDDSGLMSWPPVSQHIRCASRREIGRASCRERVLQYVSISVVAGSLKKKITEEKIKTSIRLQN